MATVSFSLGKNLGVQLHEISIEHLYEFDVKKAVSLWEDSFRFGEKIVEELTMMKLICDVSDEKNCMVSVNKREEVDEERLKDYPSLDIENIIRKIKRLFSTGIDIDEENWFVDFRYQMSNVRRYIFENKYITYEFDYEDIKNLLGGIGYTNLTAHAEITPIKLVKYMFANDITLPKEFDIEKIAGYDKKRAFSIVYIITACNTIISLKDNINETMALIEKHYPVSKAFKYKLESAFSDVEIYIDELKRVLDNCKN